MGQERDHPNQSLEELLRGSEPSRGGAAPPADGGGEFTRMFKALSLTPEALPEDVGSGRVEAVPRGPVAPEPAPAVVAAPSTSASAEGFTQVVQQIAKPTSTPPGAAKEASPSAPAGGGFTQIFSSFQVPSEPAKTLVEPAPAPVARAAPAPAMQVFAAPTPAQPGEFTQMFRSLTDQPVKVAEPARPMPAAQEVPVTALPVFAAPTPAQPGEFTQMFRSLQVDPEPAKAAETGKAAEPVKQAAPPAQVPPAHSATAHFEERPKDAGSFTQIFQQIKPTAQHAKPTLPKVEAVGGPVFGAAAASGSFTEVFRAAAPNPAPASPARGRDDFGQAFAAPAASKPAQAEGGGFTQMFQALSEAPARPNVQPQGLAFGGNAAAPMFPAASAAPTQPAAGGGEFTRLMHSLEQPSSPSQNAVPQAAAALPFFAEAPQTGGASEFTRVMRGPGFKDAARPAAAAVAAAPVAPGMSIAPAKAEDKPAEKKTGGMSKGLVILLVVFNVVLLVALIVLVVILLKKH